MIWRSKVPRAATWSKQWKEEVPCGRVQNFFGTEQELKRRARAGLFGSLVHCLWPHVARGNALKFSWPQIFLTMRRKWALDKFLSSFPYLPQSAGQVCQCGFHSTFSTTCSEVVSVTYRAQLRPANSPGWGCRASRSNLDAGASVFLVYYACNVLPFSPLSACFRWRIQGIHGKISKTTRPLPTGSVSICSWWPCPLLVTGMFMQKPRSGVSSWSSSSSGDW